MSTADHTLCITFLAGRILLIYFECFHFFSSLLAARNKNRVSMHERACIHSSYFGEHKQPKFSSFIIFRDCFWLKSSLTQCSSQSHTFLWVSSLICYAKWNTNITWPTKQNKRSLKRTKRTKTRLFVGFKPFNANKAASWRKKGKRKTEWRCDGKTSKCMLDLKME